VGARARARAGRGLTLRLFSHKVCAAREVRADEDLLQLLEGERL
jgi:hypothetical protein